MGKELIDELKKYISENAIRWSARCLERMQERDISRANVKKCVLEGEIIEDYPDDFPHPSCLIFGYTINDKIIHVVNYKNSIIVIKNVPCEECEQCGEKYYTDEVAEQLEKMVNLAKQMMQEIAVLDYSKVA